MGTTTTTMAAKLIAASVTALLLVACVIVLTSNVSTDSAVARATELAFYNPFQRCASTDNQDDCNALCDLYDATTGFLPCLPDADIRLKLIMPCWMNNTGWVGSKTGLCGRGSGSLCTWFGVQCDADGRVSGLNLGTDADNRVAGNKLSGKIPDSIGKLERMAVLDLGDNDMKGTIPDSIGELKVLTNLTITRSKELTGSIPDSIGQCEKLVALELYDNGLTGSIPDSIGKLKALRSANLFLNGFTGTIPESIGNLKALEILYLNFFEDDEDKLANQFTGTIPDTISQCTALKELFLSNNQFSGTISEFMANLEALTELFLDNNKFSGTIPDLTKLDRLDTISLAKNHLSGTIPSSMGNMDALTDLYLNDNELTGPIPDSFGNFKAMIVPNDYSQGYLKLSNNKLTGTIPNSIGKLKNLGGLFINNNSFTSWTGDSVCSLLGHAGRQGDRNYSNGDLLECDMSGNTFACPLPACARASVDKFDHLRCKATCK